MNEQNIERPMRPSVFLIIIGTLMSAYLAWVLFLAAVIGHALDH